MGRGRKERKGVVGREGIGAKDSKGLKTNEDRVQMKETKNKVRQSLQCANFANATLLFQ